MSAETDLDDQRRQADQRTAREDDAHRSQPLREEVAKKVFWKRVAAGAIAVAGAAVTLLVKRGRR
jgi:hypothetical protein